MKTPLYILLVVATAGAIQANDLASILAPLTKPAAPEASAEAPAPAADRALISEGDLASALSRELKAQLALEGDLRVSLTQHWTSPSIPATSPWEVKVLQSPSGGLTSTSLIRFRIDCEGQRVGEWQMVVRAQLMRPVWTASARIARSQALDSSTCQKVNVDMLREKQPPVTAETDIATYEASQPLTPDQVLTWKDITPRVAIRKGQVVQVVAAEGAMNITMKGTAMTSGCVGENIIVRNIDSSRNISARVLNSTSASVNF